MDAIVAWFDLHLDENSSISTSPAANTSWEQAVFPLCSVLSSSVVVVCIGDELVIDAGCTDTQLTMEVTSVRKTACGEQNSATFQTDSCSYAYPSSCSSLVSVRQASCNEVHYVAREELRRMNDVVYMESYRRAVRLAIQDCLECETSSCVSSDNEENKNLHHRIGPMNNDYAHNEKVSLCKDDVNGHSLKIQANEEEEKEEDSDSSDSDGHLMANCIVLDITTGFSLFGLMAANDGASFVQIGGTHSVYDDLLHQLAQQNNVDRKVSVRQLDCSNLISQLDWDVVVCDLVSPQGTLQTETILTLQALW